MDAPKTPDTLENTLERFAVLQTQFDELRALYERVKAENKRLSADLPDPVCCGHPMRFYGGRGFECHECGSKRAWRPVKTPETAQNANLGHPGAKEGHSA